MNVLLGLAVLAGLAQAPARAGDEGRFKLGVITLEVFPWITAESELYAQRPGIAVELSRAAAVSCGLGVDEFVWPARRLSRMLATAEIDGMLMASFNPDRTRWAAYPMLDGKPDGRRRLATLAYHFYVRKEAANTWDGQRLHPVEAPIGTNTISSITEILEDLGLPVIRAGRQIQHNLGMLARGRLDAYAELATGVDAWLRTHPKMDARRLDPPIVSRDYFLLLGHGFLESRPEDAACIWEGVARLREETETLLLPRYIEAIE